MPIIDPTKYLTEMEIPEDERYDPPAGIQIFRPFKELTQFFPCPKPEATPLWIVPFEERYLQPLAEGVAKVFQVPLIDDADYHEMSEEQKATLLSCCLTHAEILQIHPGTFTWCPVVVVVKYMVMVAIKVEVTPNEKKIIITQMKLWNNAAQEYAEICDPQKGYIENPAVLLQILHRYAEMESLL